MHASSCSVDKVSEWKTRLEERDTKHGRVENLPFGLDDQSTKVSDYQL